MQFFICLILYLCLFIKYCTSNYILCTSQCSQITLSFFDPLTLPIECQENNNITDYGLICIIDYRIDYDAKEIYINFKITNDTKFFKEHNQSEYLIQALWLGFNQESKQPNITHRTYGCNTKNDCARQFYLNTIEYLITDGKLQLDKINSKLYNHSLSQNKFKSQRCKDSNRTRNKSLIQCKNGLCYAHNINKKQFCIYDNTPILFSEMEYYLPKSIINERELIEYRCNINLCNRKQMMDIIKKILIDYTNWYHIKKDENFIKEKSSTNHHYVSYGLIILCFIFFILK